MDDKENKWDFSFKNIVFPLIFLGIFWGLAILLSITSGTIFYLFNFDSTAKTGNSTP